MIKILIVDDSPLFAAMLKARFSAFPGIQVVGVASDPYEARDLILELDPDIMTLDIEMPKMDGVKFLQKLLPQYALPVIMISSSKYRKADAMEAGAAGFRVKPSSSDKEEFTAFIEKTVEDIRRLCPDKAEPAKPAAASKSAVSGTTIPKNKVSAPSVPKIVSSSGTVSHASQVSPVSSGASGGKIYSCNGYEIVALGASTGGTDALEKVVTALPANCPPVIITQHMPPVFTKMYSERLNRSSALTVCEAVDGMRLEKGMCVIAEGGKHMELKKDSQGYYITSREGEKVSGHCPSVDVMFRSAAKCAGRAVVAAILTGMGADGAKGLLELRKCGAYTIGQNKETCVVYGMPMEAFKMGAVCEEAPLEEISTLLLRKMHI